MIADAQNTRRRSDVIRLEITELEQRAQKDSQRVDEIKESLRKNSDKEAREKLHAEWSQIGGFKSILPELLQPLKDELTEAEKIEREELIASGAARLKEATQKAIDKFSKLLGDLEKFTADLEKINNEFHSESAVITGIKASNPDQYFLGESWSLLALVGQVDFSPKTLRALLAELPQRYAMLPESKAEEHIDRNAPRISGRYAAWQAANREALCQTN